MSSRVFQSFSQLHGDRCYGDDPAILGGVADLQGHPVVLIAQWGQMMPMPEGFRKAHRLLRLAEKCGLPVVTLVDTRGAFPGLEAEHRGIALTIGENLAALARLPVPIVNVVIGEGGSGGALALGLADVILMQENANLLRDCPGRRGGDPAARRHPQRRAAAGPEAQGARPARSGGPRRHRPRATRWCRSRPGRSGPPGARARRAPPVPTSRRSSRRSWCNAGPTGIVPSGVSSVASSTGCVISSRGSRRGQ